MIAYIKGQVVLSQNNFVILESAGVGYRIFVNPSLNLGEAQEAIFFIHHHFRENGQELYGFKTYSELELFEKLISVNGIGPKAAMSILSSSEVAQITSAITQGDVVFFTNLPGIGKKVAAKIILDLKKKVSGIEAGDMMARIDEADDVVESLTALGYKKFEVAKILSKMPADVVALEDKIKWCLKNLSKVG